jgi:hypothetical protein
MAPAPTISPAALAAFRHAVPRLLVFTNEKFKLESAYAGADASTVNAAHIEQFNSDLAGLLSGVYAFNLFGNLDGEVIRLAGILTAHGAGRGIIEAGLKAWVMALQTIIKRPESEELTAPLISIIQRFTSLWARAEVAPPQLDGPALRLHDFLLDRNRKFAAETVLEMLRSGTTIEQAYQGTLLPALLNIQLKQRQGIVTAAQEQAASDICRYIMYRVLDTIFNERRLPFKILAVCMPFEQDLLGSELFANFLEVQGWSLLFMRETHTTDETVQAAASFEPHIVLLSASSIQSLPHAAELASIIRQHYPRTRIAFEGRSAQLARESLCEYGDAIVSGFENGHQTLLKLLTEC